MPGPIKDLGLSGLEEAIEYRFKDRALLLEALTHRSYHHEHPRKAPRHNERLEFLGDSVLGLIIASRLFGSTRDMSEAEMSKLKSRVVDGKTLSEAAGDVSLGSYLMVGRGEEETGGREKVSVRADALEALIGAVYLDSGLEAASRVTLGLLGGRLDGLMESGEPGDYKTMLQEETQMRSGALPEYRQFSEEGKAHKKTFGFEVYVNGELMGRGSGRTKKEAQSQAAKEALRKIEKTRR